ncbi:MAG TPA: magnesium transporter, partial [Longimicrobiaceae bacterium]|nr:magnesium transporter [Longimicrobiaceae bacterium]
MAQPTVRATRDLQSLLLGDPTTASEVLHDVRAADLAHALNNIRRRTPAEASRALLALPFDIAVQVLDEPELEQRVELLADLVRSDVATLATFIEAMSADQPADLLREFPDAVRTGILAELTPGTRRSLEILLRYPPTTAGGLMTTAFVAVPSAWTVERTLQHVGRVAGAMETVYEIYVLDGGSSAPGRTRGPLKHVVSLRELITSDRDLRIADVCDRRVPLTVGPLTDQEEVARLIAKYNLLSVPVVDTDGSVLGIVTVDDVIDAIVAEQTEDVQRFGGVDALDTSYTETGFWALTWKRSGWLTVLFFGEMLTATAMGYFEDEIARAVVLALFVPLIISSGGNSGSQATSLVIRGLALDQLQGRHWWRVALRELGSGLTLGTILGAVGVARIVGWHAAGWYDYGPHYQLLALTVGLALVGVVAFGSLAGSMLPFLLRRIGFDPVTASAPFVATLVDVTGLVIYFSVALLILRGTML